MADITLSRSDCAVCMTRLAMRPAKSFWKNGQLCRSTCQWLCQRTMLVTPGISALWRIAMSAICSSGRTISTTSIIADSTGAFAASAAARSGAAISATSWPMKTGMLISASATPRLVTTMAT